MAVRQILEIKEMPESLNEWANKSSIFNRLMLTKDIWVLADMEVWWSSSSFPVSEL